MCDIMRLLYRVVSVSVVSIKCAITGLFKYSCGSLLNLYCIPSHEKVVYSLELGVLKL